MMRNLQGALMRNSYIFEYMHHDISIAMAAILADAAISEGIIPANAVGLSDICANSCGVAMLYEQDIIKLKLHPEYVLQDYAGQRVNIDHRTSGELLRAVRERYQMLFEFNRHSSPLFPKFNSALLNRTLLDYYKAADSQERKHSVYSLNIIDPHKDTSELFMIPDKEQVKNSMYKSNAALLTPLPDKVVDTHIDHVMRTKDVVREAYSRALARARYLSLTQSN